MKYEIWIPISPTQYDSAEWVSIRDVERGEMKIWCMENGIQLGSDYHYQFVKCLHDGIHCHVFNFEKADHAVLFKLRFGGMAPNVRPRSSGNE